MSGVNGFCSLEHNEYLKKIECFNKVDKAKNNYSDVTLMCSQLQAYPRWGNISFFRLNPFSEQCNNNIR